MNRYNVIASGSTGNSVIYHKNIMVDCGVPFSRIKPFLYDIKIVLLTHIHGDHFNLSTIKRLAFERPSLRFGCCEWLSEHLEGVKNVDIYNIGSVYDYGLFKIIPIKLYHDVPNCGYRIITNDYKIIHATDTNHLNGISAPNYNLYALEHNYDENIVKDVIKEKELRGEYSYEKYAINAHLSEQQANDFYYKNKGENSEILRLHETSLLKELRKWEHQEKY
jgi:ribonuclease BN (tRNA processing enzyme)